MYSLNTSFRNPIGGSSYSPAASHNGHKEGILKIQDVAAQNLSSQPSSDALLDLYIRQEANLLVQSKESKLPISFAEWKEMQQDLTTVVENNTLIRNGRPLGADSKFVFFVLGRDEKLYCSKKLYMFDFYTGALSVDEQGCLRTLCNSNSINRPDEKSDFFILDYFFRQGVDLSKVQFISAGSFNSTAQNYYDYLSYEFLDDDKVSDNHPSDLTQTQ